MRRKRTPTAPRPHRRVDPNPLIVARETLAACDLKLNLRDRISIAAH